MNRRRSGWAYVGLIAVLGACGDDDDDDVVAVLDAGGQDAGDSGPDAAVQPDAAADLDASVDGGGDSGPVVATVLVAGTVTDYLTGDLIEGIEVCVYELPELSCATTDADGVYRLPGVPQRSELRLTYLDGAGAWMPMMFSLRTEDQDDVGLSLRMIGADVAAGLAATAGLALDPARGTIPFQGFYDPGEAAGQALDGLSAVLSPDDAEVRGFLTEMNTVDAQLDSTTSVGLGLFINVAAGEHTVQMTHPERECTLSPLGWPGATPDETRIDVVPGFLMGGADVTCALPD